MRRELLLAGILLPTILAVIIPHNTAFAFHCDTSGNATCASQEQASSSSNSCTSEGCNGDFACVNPVQPGPGCPNDQPKHQHHTAEYLQGLKLGKSDGKLGVPPDPGSPDPNWSQTQDKHYDQGYYDGYKSTYICTSSPCNTVP